MNNVEKDKQAFLKALEEAQLPKPTDTWGDDDEAGFEWKYSDKGKHAVVILEGLGELGYTTYEDGKFTFPKDKNAPCDKIPQDLLEYLKIA